MAEEDTGSSGVASKALGEVLLGVGSRSPPSPGAGAGPGTKLLSSGLEVKLRLLQRPQLLPVVGKSRSSQSRLPTGRLQL